MTGTPEVAVILPSFRRFEPLLDALGDLLNQEGVRFEIVVLDQNARWPEAVLGRREKLRADLRVRWFDGLAPGVVAARNLGVETATAPILLFVDDDVRIPDRRFLARHLAAYDSEEIAMVCGRELREEPGLPGAVQDECPGPRGPSPRATAREALDYLLAFDRGGTRRVFGPVFSTCNGSVRREALLSVGGFDESFEGASYGDDADLALRLYAAGAQIVFDPRPWLVHLLAPAGGLRLSDGGTRFTEFERALSGWIFLLRHGRGRRLRLVYGWVLRRTLLLRKNALRPWLWPGILWALSRSFGHARRLVARGARSRFTRGGSDR
jgi:GT2 family glycosyltransferase